MGKIFDFEPEWKRLIKLFYKFLNIVLSRKIYEILLFQNRMPWITKNVKKLEILLHKYKGFIYNTIE